MFNAAEACHMPTYRTSASALLISAVGAAPVCLGITRASNPATETRPEMLVVFFRL
jgi:hypothetical protein